MLPADGRCGAARHRSRGLAPPAGRHAGAAVAAGVGGRGASVGRSSKGASSVTVAQRASDRAPAAHAPVQRSGPAGGVGSAAPASAEQAVEDLRAFVGDDLAGVNAVILEKMQSPVALIPQLAGHIVAAGGKRLRPLLTLAAARMCGHRGRRHVLLAACVEFIHTATLLHDDVVDASDLRRGRATANAVWGNKASVLVGDFLFSRAFELMVSDGSLDVLRILSHASATIAEGEVLQLVTANDMATDEAAYLQVIESKTARLFAAASQIGAVVAGRPKGEEAALEAYGLNLGMAFQLVDDVLDYAARQAELGKAIGDDFRDGKVTLPVIFAFARGSEEERSFWRRCLEEQSYTDEDLLRATDLLVRHDALQGAMAVARRYGETARSALAVFPASEGKRVLGGLVDFCVARAY
ncbi:MAG: polyprenyl synthetase family protein [Alphaproteobacteria bacterium]|nr:polyprenyl synthetase family protein [Alphaproteobacteria bacterium]